MTGARGRLPWEGALLIAPLFIAASGLGIVDHPSLTWLMTWGTTIVFGVGAALCGWHAREGGPVGRTWRWFTLACGLWFAANLYYAVVVSPGVLPIPSPADVGYFFFPWAIAAGLITHVRHRVGEVPPDALLDGLIAGLTIAALGAAVIDQLAGADTHDLSALITTVLYPLEDAIVLGLIVGIVSVLGWRPGRVVAILGVAIVLITLSDMGAFVSVVVDGRIGGAAINAGWAAAVVLFTVAARVDDGSVAAIARRAGQSVEIPVVFFVASVLLLALGGALSLGVVTTTLAALALAACAARLWRAFREIQALAESRALALTDELTGLANRRRLLFDLRRACDGGDRCRLAIFDLDGFKAFNDRFGHPDGDRLLATLARQLERAVAGHGRAYRLGGDEFCVLLDATASADMIDRAEGALQDEGVGWSVRASFGVAEIPAEASDPSAAMRLADRRMYAQKERRPLAARQQARDVLLSALGEQQPDLHAHTRDVTELAGAVARRLEMTMEQIDDVVRAAELHDIGKLAIPREILEKPGPLNDDEWAVMRRHTLIGARMLVVAPSLHTVAPLVRSSHERWDGRGYPDQLAGEEIPLGARIVSVCDAFDAMTADRVYRPGMPMAEAVQELRACAGTQFDPRVVEAFLAVVALPADAA